jgi:O-antigen ligase
MTDIRSEDKGFPQSLFWAIVVMAAGITIGMLAGGMSNPFLLFVAIAGLVVVFLMFQNPERALVALVFITYTMLSEILADHHGAPSITKFIVLLLVLLLMARWLLRNERPSGGGTSFMVVVIFGLILSISLLHAINSDRAAEGLNFYIKDAAIVVIITLMLKRGDELRHVTWAILAGGMFLGTISTYQYLTGTFENAYWGFAQAEIQHIAGKLKSYRIGGPIGDPNFYGQLLLVAVPLAINRLRNEEANFARIMALYALSVCLLSIAFTFSRGAFLATGIVMMVMLVKNPPRPAVLAVALPLVATVLFLLMPQYVERMYTIIGSIFNPGGESTQMDSAIQGRMGEMRVALAMFADQPLLGVGLGNYESYFQKYNLLLNLPPREGDRAAHSLYLELAAERGLLGLAAFFTLIWYISRTIIRSRKKLQSAGLTSLADLVSSYGYALLGYLIAASFLHGSHARFFWVMLGISLAFPAIANYETARVRSVVRENPATRDDGDFQIPVPGRGTSGYGSP